MKKPSAKTIAEAVPLTQRSECGIDPLAGQCQLCAADADAVLLGVWREHDEHDQPLAGTDALLFIDRGHVPCMAAMEAHPRLYAEETGRPGSFPEICGPCTHRQNLECDHPKLTKNGGTGLTVMLSGLPAIICYGRGRGGCTTPLKRATKCEGREAKT